MHLHKIEKKAYHLRGGACLQGKGWYSKAIPQYCSLQLKLPLLAIKKLGLPIFSGVGPLCWLQTQLAGREKLGSRATLNSAALRCWWAAAALCGKVGRRPRHRSGPTSPPPPPPHSSTSPQGLKLSPPVPLSFKLPSISWQRVSLNRDPNPGKRSHLPSLTSGHL